MEVFIINTNDRAILLGQYIIETGDTVRGAAAEFGIGKSTVHSDIQKKLKIINVALWRMADAVLQKNKDERHIRGGNATKLKYQKLKNDGEFED